MRIFTHLHGVCWLILNWSTTELWSLLDEWEIDTRWQFDELVFHWFVFCMQSSIAVVSVYRVYDDVLVVGCRFIFILFVVIIRPLSVHDLCSLILVIVISNKFHYFVIIYHLLPN